MTSANAPDWKPEYVSAPQLEKAFVHGVCALSYEDLPVEVIDAARRAIVWFVWTAEAGASVPGSTAVYGVAREMGRQDGCSTVFGLRESLGADAAAFTNACFSKAHEYEDKHWLTSTGGYAMGFAIVAAALAVAEEQRASGLELLEAVAIAIEAQMRLLDAVVDPQDISPGATGWNCTYLFSNFGAAIATARLLRLSPEQTLDCLGLVHAQACGNLQGQMEGVMGIRLQGGFATRNGMTAARLAKQGVTGARQFLSGQFGFFALFFPDARVDTDSLVEGLGTSFRAHRLGFKAYPCGLVAHPAIDGILSIRDQAPISDVVRIDVTGHQWLAIMSTPIEEKRAPHGFIQSQFSLPYAVSCALQDGSFGLHHFQEGTLGAARYRRLSELVHVDMTATPEDGTVVELSLVDGRRVRSEAVHTAHGHPDNPITHEELVDLYTNGMRYAPHPIGEALSQSMLLSIQSLDVVSDIRELMSPLQGVSD